ncbi:MAG: tail fiber domain-containing protein [Bacteroidetes bacterium]|nr:tail fiber domain-containing protein [Bacteroidota bacterium]
MACFRRFYTNYGVYGTCSGGTAWAGYFNGAVFGTSYTTSDRKLKNNIQPLRNSMEIINRLQPTTYYYKTEEYKHLQLSEGLQYGLIADEVQEVIPSAIKKAVTPAMYENGDEKHGKKLSDAVEFNAMNYTEIIPILVGGMQEQQKEIEALKKQNETLLKLLEELKNK